MTYTKKQLKERLRELWTEYKSIPESDLLERIVCMEKIGTIQKYLKEKQ
jgi:hypothetical protein